MVDTSKKSNRKCEHCENWKDEKCGLTNEPKRYWNACKQFKWKAEYFTTDAIIEQKRKKVASLKKSIEKTEKDTEALKRQIEALENQRNELIGSVCRARKELRDTLNVRIGDLLYYIDHEESKSCYKVVDELSVSYEEESMLFPGDYFVVQPLSGIGRGFVNIEKVNCDRFFTSPELAHDAYMKHKENKQKK